MRPKIAQVNSPGITKELGIPEMKGAGQLVEIPEIS